MDFSHPTFGRCIIYATPNVHPIGLINNIGSWDKIFESGYGTILEGPSVTRGFLQESTPSGRNCHCCRQLLNIIVAFQIMPNYGYERSYDQIIIVDHGE